MTFNHINDDSTNHIEHLTADNTNNISCTSSTSSCHSAPIMITKVILDFDDCLFPSSVYRKHDLLRYRECSHDDPFSSARSKFTELEPNFLRLKKDIDLKLFKLMQLYGKENLVIVSTGDYQWIKSTLTDYDYLLYNYNIEILSTQQYHKEHPQQSDFNVANSLQSKQFLMKRLLSRWRAELNAKYTAHQQAVQLRVICIGDSFFEFLACYKIGFDRVNRIKLLEDPSVDHLIKQWSQMLVLTDDDEKRHAQNIVFMTDSEYFYLDEQRMHTLHEQCIDRLKHSTANANGKSQANGRWLPLHEIITKGNTECYEIVSDDDGKQYERHKKLALFQSTNAANTANQMAQRTPSPVTPQQSEIQPALPYAMANHHRTTSHDHQPSMYHSQFQHIPMTMSNMMPSIEHQMLYSQQQLLYAQQLLQHHQQMQSQYFVDVPQYTTYSVTPPVPFAAAYTSMTYPVITSNLDATPY